MNWTPMISLWLDILDSIKPEKRIPIGTVTKRTGIYFIGIDKTRYELQARMTDCGIRWAFFVDPNNITGTTAANGHYDSRESAMQSFYTLYHHKELNLIISEESQNPKQPRVSRPRF